MALTLTFYGGAGKVTGSNFLIEGSESKILVDCGLEQGRDFCEECMYGPFAYDPTSVSALVITHAHLDHVGLIPKLVHEGFRGSIYLTPPTGDLTELILRDAVAILAQEAERLGHEPLYTDADVDATIALFKPIEYHTETPVAGGISVYLRHTGHILGAASVRVTAKDETVLTLTGDIGNPSPLLPTWEAVGDSDAIVMESVYGNKVHPPLEKRTEHMRTVLAKAIAKGGAILIPAFSLERTELMLYELSNFYEAGTLPKVPVFLDSPLAINVLSVYEKWGSTYFNYDAQREMLREQSLFQFPFLTLAKTIQESHAIDAVPNPKIIIAGAGMSHGGRIGRHEEMYLPDKKSTLITVGYQAPGSPGRQIAEGVSRVRVNNRNVKIRATIENLGEWSAHADRDELLTFAEAAAAGKRVKTIFTALGEPAAERFLAQRIHDFLGVRAIAAEAGQTWEVSRFGTRKL